MEYHSLSSEEVLLQLKTRKSGLTEQEVVLRKKTFGDNELTEKKKKGLLSKLLAQFQDLMILILLAAALVSFLSSFLSGELELAEPLIILGIVVLNAILGVVQEAKAEHSLKMLRKLCAPEAVVLRNGKRYLIPAKDLVPGDIIQLYAGTLVSADARLIFSDELTVNESALTGESEPVHKNPNRILPESAPVSDRINMVSAGTVLLTGNALAVVTATGMQTQVGKIAALMDDDFSPETPLKKHLTHTGKILCYSVIAICIFVFLLGIIQGRDFLPMFMTAVSLGVAAIPEGLPAIVTIALSLGVQRMARKKAIVRHLPAVETLGSATVICSDKTGTLTQNKMTVVSLSDGMQEQALTSKEGSRISFLAALCNNSYFEPDGTPVGEPTELALLKAAKQSGCFSTVYTEQLHREKEFAFSSERKCMSTIHRLLKKNNPSAALLPVSCSSILICKGAPEIVLQKCTGWFRKEEILPLTAAAAERLLALQSEYAGKALRVLAVAYRPLSDSLLTAFLKSGASAQEAEKELVFLGFLCLMDPPRKEAKECVHICKEAGITPVMITGDHALTAYAIARQLNICGYKDRPVTGSELSKMTEEELTECVGSCRVFARVSPEHKVAIVRAFKRRGEVVAMTGDGINDAPALKAADIGCAMGLSGTDVAKEAADMVLMDDNFQTIVVAVKEGRSIYANIRRSVHFLLSCNIGEIITILFAMLFGLPSPLMAVQLLFVNLVTDSLPAAALSVEPPEPDVMRKPPCDTKQNLLSGSLGLRILLEGAMIGGISLLAYVIGNRFFYNGTTMTFAVLSLSQLVHAFHMRSELPLSSTGFFTNGKLIFSSVFCAIMQITVITVPALAGVFQVTPLSSFEWGIVAILSLLPLPLVELQKKISLSLSYREKA